MRRLDPLRATVVVERKGSSDGRRSVVVVMKQLINIRCSVMTWLMERCEVELTYMEF